MTTKQQVNLEAYQKPPRLLDKKMEAALGPEGALHPVLVAVANDSRLRLDIRDHRFNVYYGGGSLMLVDGRKSTWELRFDKKYFKKSALNTQYLLTPEYSAKNVLAWVKAFPSLIAGMEEWWTRNPKGERTDCQDIAAANSGMAGNPPADYLVLDIEYQWAQRRLDMVAAKRRPNDDDVSGWAEPGFVFVEVKSAPAACSGVSGLGAHARDYQAIITASERKQIENIKLEYKDVIAQKKRLGLLDRSLGFKRFSDEVPEMLFVFVDITPNEHGMQAPLDEVRAVSAELGNTGRIRFMRLHSKNYVMTADNAMPLERLIAEST